MATNRINTAFHVNTDTPLRRKLQIHRVRIYATLSGIVLLVRYILILRICHLTVTMCFT